MITYKYLDADLEKIQVDLSSYINDFNIYQLGFTKLSIDEILNSSKTLIDWFDSLNCAPTSSYMINTPIGSNKKNAHVDNWIENPVYTKSTISKYVLAINIPIKNTEGTYTAFYEYIDGPVKNMEFGQHNIIYRYYGKATLKEIDRYALSKPVILNTTVPHSVINNTDKDRFALTFRFEKDPWHLFYYD
jgi:hypothetical protein